MKSKNLPAKKVSWIGLAVFFLVAASICYLVVNYKFNNIDCRSQFGECNPEILGRLEKVKGKTLFTVSKTIKDELSQSRFVKSYSTRTFPGRVSVFIDQRKARYSAVLGNNILELSDDFTILHSTPGVDDNLLRVEEGEVSPTGSLSGKLINFLKLDYMVRSHTEVLSAVVVSDSLRIITKDGVEYIFPADKDLDYMTGAFVLIYGQLNNVDGETRINNGSSGVKVVDMRFNNPVLKY